MLTYLCLQTVEQRNNDQYIKDTLKACLKVELDYLEEKRQIEEQAKIIMGNEVSKKMHDVGEARIDAYVSSGKIVYNNNTSNIRITKLYY